MAWSWTEDADGGGRRRCDGQGKEQSEEGKVGVKAEGRRRMVLVESQGG
jgi:hypothetical protein